MGVIGLNQYLLNNVSKESKTIQKIYMNNLNGKTIAVDASIYIYKFFVNNDYKTLNSNINKMIDNFKLNRVIPIFVFDGKSLKNKEELINKRNNERIDAEIIYNNMIDNYENKDKLNRLEKLFVKPTKDTINYVKTILNNRNIKFINAENEADPICAWLVKSGKAWACLSDDTDMFIYGCPRVLRSYSVNTKSLMLYDFEKILLQLNITFNDFREICVISGTDYNINDNINIINAFKLFYEFKNNSNKEEHFIEWLISNNHIIDNLNYYNILEIMNINNLYC
jgi:5'-3' exonuclease